jgi:hypothetical protein
MFERSAPVIFTLSPAVSCLDGFRRDRIRVVNPQPVLMVSVDGVVDEWRNALDAQIDLYLFALLPVDNSSRLREEQ